MLNKKLFLILILFIFVFVFGSYATAKPSILWSSKRIAIEAGPTDTFDINVSFKSQISASDLTTFVVPEIAPFISVVHNPVVVTKGENVELILRVSIPVDASINSSFDGTVHVKSGKKTIARPLSVKLKLIERSLSGGDKNSNGVRDDIDVLVADMFPDNPPKREMALDIGRAHHDIFPNLFELNDAELRSSFMLAADASLCLMLVGENPPQIRGQITNRYLDTFAGRAAYKNFDQRIGELDAFGTRSRRELNEYCDSQYSGSE